MQSFKANFCRKKSQINFRIYRRKFYEKILFIIAILVLLSHISNAQAISKHEKNESEIRQVVQNIVDAWATGDGVKYADNFTDDVDYTVWNGHKIRGRKENIKDHQLIFDTFYKGTKIATEIKKISFLTDDIAAVHVQSIMYKGDKRVEDVPTTLPLMIFKKANGRWRVAVFQNTPIIKQGELQLKRDSKE